jgi:hypothetical protein
MRRRFRIVGSEDPTDVFDNLEALRREQQQNNVTQRRTRLRETFARIPHNRGLSLHRHNIGSTAWTILIELDRLILTSKGRNPVKLTNHSLRALGISRKTKLRALQKLEAAGVISVEQRGREAPWVTHLWYPAQD